MMVIECWYFAATARVFTASSTFMWMGELCLEFDVWMFS